MNGIWISLTSYCRWWQILLYTVGAVSYTHLDVYKRQRERSVGARDVQVDSSMIEFAEQLFQFPRTAAMIPRRTDTVSYTHLKTMTATLN